VARLRSLRPARAGCGRGARPAGGLFCFLLVAATVAAADSDSPYGRRILEVRSRPAPLPVAQLSLQPGQVLTSSGLSMAMNEIRNHLGRRGETLAAFTGGGVLSFTYVTADFEFPDLPAGDGVIVTLRPVHLSLPMGDPAARILPGPRDPAFSLVPGRAATPAWWPAGLQFGHDRVLGPTAGARWQGQAGPVAADERARLFRFRLAGTTALTKSWHEAAGDARAALDRSSGAWRHVSAGIEASGTRTPRGAARLDRRSFGGTAAAVLALDANTRFRFDTRWAGVRERLAGAGPDDRWRDAREWTQRLGFESIPARVLGFMRAAIWHETIAPRHAATAQRVVVRAGYAKEFPVGRNRSIGFEMIAGAGEMRGATDLSRRYFAGGSQGDFLAGNAAGPVVPTVLGTGQGGRGFRHLNLTVSLPVARWSRPLIPDEPTDLPGPDGTPQTLQQVLRTQVDRTGPNLLQSSLQVSDGLSPDEARRRAERIFGEIRPATHFVIEQANVFAVKPLLMFDAATLESGLERSTWTAAGTGVQVVVVTAKLDLGYMRTLSGPRLGSRGNLFARLSFARLF